MIERGNVMRHLLFPADAEGLYDLGPFAGRYQRYVNAHMDVLKRDREGVISAPGDAGEDISDSEESMMMAPSANMINEGPTYDLPYGVFNGKTMAFARIKAPNQAPADFSLTSMLQKAGATNVSDALTYLERRFLRLPLSPSVRDTIRKTIEAGNGGADLTYSLPQTEQTLRELLHSIMSAPEYQLG